MEEHVVQTLLLVIVETFFAEDEEELDGDHAVALLLTCAVAHRKAFELHTVAAALPPIDEFDNVLGGFAANLEHAADSIVALKALIHWYSPEKERESAAGLQHMRVVHPNTIFVKVAQNRGFLRPVPYPFTCIFQLHSELTLR